LTLVLAPPPLRSSSACAQPSCRARPAGPGLFFAFSGISRSTSSTYCWVDGGAPCTGLCWSRSPGPAVPLRSIARLPVPVGPRWRRPRSRMLGEICRARPLPVPSRNSAVCRRYGRVAAVYIGRRCRPGPVSSATASGRPALLSDSVVNLSPSVLTRPRSRATHRITHGRAASTSRPGDGELDEAPDYARPGEKPSHLSHAT